MKVKVESSYMELGQNSRPIPKEAAEVELDSLTRFSVKVPPKTTDLGVGSAPLPLGYSTDPADPSNTWVDYTSDQIKFLAILMPMGARYSAATQGASDINSVSSVVIKSASSSTPKLVFDAPIILVEDSLNLSFSDFFGNEIPGLIEVYNSFNVINEVDILLGIKL